MKFAIFALLFEFDSIIFATSFVDMFGSRALLERRLHRPLNNTVREPKADQTHTPKPHSIDPRNRSVSHLETDQFVTPKLISFGVAT